MVIALFLGQLHFYDPMNLYCNPELAGDKRSSLQRTRLITEAWFGQEGYCLNCDSTELNSTPAGTIARDFSCPKCDEPYELKSASSRHGDVVPDGGFYAMVGRLYVGEAPTLMLAQYSRTWCIDNLLAISSTFLTPEIVRRRDTPHTRKSGASYQMCDLDLSLIPSDGRIVVVEDAKARPPWKVRAEFRASRGLEQIPVEKRGATAAMLGIVRRINKPAFTLVEVYAHEQKMQALFPDNRHIRPKMRQQLQVLRDLGYLDFLGGGNYRVLQAISATQR